MAATLHDLSAIHYENEIGGLDGLQTVGDDDGCFAFHETVQGLEDELFGGRIQTSGGLIEDQRWPPERVTPRSPITVS